DPGPFTVKRLDDSAGLADVRGLQTLRALHDLELHRLTLGEAAETIHHDGGVVDEHVRRPLARDEAKTLRVVKPLHSALFHCDSFGSGARIGPQRRGACNLLEG